MKPRNSLTSRAMSTSKVNRFSNPSVHYFQFFPFRQLNLIIEASVAEAHRQLAIAESNKIASERMDEKVNRTIAEADAVLSQVHTPRNF